MSPADPSAPPSIDRQILEASPFAHVVYTSDLTILEINARHCALTGRKREDLLGRKLFDAFPANPAAPDADAEAPLRASVERAIATGETDDMSVQKHDITDASGGYQARYWRISHSPVFADPERHEGIVAVLQTLRDVTQEKLAKYHNAAQLRMAHAVASLNTYDFDPATGGFDRSPNVDRLFGFEPGEAGPLAKHLFARLHPDDRATVEAEIAAVLEAPSHTVAHFDCRVVYPDGTTRWILARGEVVRDPLTQDPHIVGMLVDVTPLKQNEEALAEAVRTRDVLLVEVNHRVKNSLQLVTSVLNLEAMRAAGTEAADGLRRAASRVQAIASVHGVLYQTGDMRTVDLGTFLRNLCEHIHTSSGGQERSIELIFEIEKEAIFIATDRAISLSLVINELLTNSLKHAFPDGRHGRVSVRLARSHDDRVIVEVADDGIGRNGTLSDVEPLKKDLSTGLGSKLISSLSRQIDAKLIDMHVDPGHAVRLEFHV